MPYRDHQRTSKSESRPLTVSIAYPKPFNRIARACPPRTVSYLGRGWFFAVRLNSYSSLRRQPLFQVLENFSGPFCPERDLLRIDRI